jgi:hypothetical protein
MPAENGVGRDDGGHITKTATAQSISVDSQPTAFHIRQPEPAGHVPTQDTVLFDQVGHGVLLSLVEPAGQRGQNHRKEERVEHGGRVYTTDLISGSQRPSANNEIYGVDPLEALR